MSRHITKPRALQEYYRFNIVIKNWEGYEYFSKFTKPDGSDQPYYFKLTPGQWKKASKYLTRNLIPFCGYQYEVKPEYQSEQLITIK